MLPFICFIPKLLEGIPFSIVWGCSGIFTVLRVLNNLFVVSYIGALCVMGQLYVEKIPFVTGLM